MRFFGRTFSGLVLLAVSLALLGLAVDLVAQALRARGEGGGPGGPAAERVFSARVVAVAPGTITPRLTAFGEVRASRTLDLRAPMAGTVAWVADGLADGVAVAAGAALIRLDPTDAEDALALATADAEQARADLAEAEAAVTLAADDLAAARVQADLRARALARQQDLQARGLGSDAAVETAALSASSADQAVLGARRALQQAEAAVASGRVAVTRADLALAEARRALEDTALSAPFAGRLDAVAAVPGGKVGANEVLARLIDPATLEVAFRVPTAQFQRLIDAGGALQPLPVTVSLDLAGLELTVPGRLARVGAAVGEGQSGRQVFAMLEGGQGLSPGDFVTVRVDEPALDGVALLPASAVGPAGTVLVLGPEDRLEEVAVDVLRRQGDEVIVAAATLAGREVVAERSPLLGAGIRVRPVRPGADGAPVAPAPAEEALLDLTEDRRARLIAFVEGNDRMPAEAKARVLEQLRAARVPAQVVERLESRMGG